ncbi:MAG: 3'-5' exonuclease [Veillonellaceae bacterium]|jgi:DNA polymerase-3 subunit epsilon|nr:3'-5' exonuclease [Veillonellaceae bacterium]
MNFVAIDFETANRYRSSACSMAVVTVEDGAVVDTAYHLIRPPVLKFDYWNTRIHGISVQDVADKPTFAELWEELRPLLEGKIIVAHNATFDISVLRSLVMEYELPRPNFKHACTVSLARKVWPGETSYKLSALAERFKLSFRHHHALDDAYICAKVAMLAGESVKAESFLSLLNQTGLTLKSFTA